MACVYRHIRLDKNEPFYIGIGLKEFRAYDKSRRNKHWYNIINISGYEVDILFDGLTWEEACEKEKEFIKMYGRVDLGTGTLCNHTDGGEGANGRIYKPTKESIEKMRLKKIGQPSPKRGTKLSQEIKDKISKSLTGRKQSKELIDKRVASCTGKKRSEQSRKNISEGRKGIVFLEEHRKNLLKSCGTKICRVDENRNVLERYDSIIECAKKTGLNKKSISAYLSDGRKYLKGYIFVKENALVSYGQGVLQNGE